MNTTQYSVHVNEKEVNILTELAEKKDWPISKVFRFALHRLHDKESLKVGGKVTAWICGEDGEPLDDTGLASLTISEQDVITLSPIDGLFYITRGANKYAFYGVQ